MDIEHRRSQFKKGLSAAEARKDRGDASHLLRRQKKQAEYAKKRVRQNTIKPDASPLATHPPASLPSSTPEPPPPSASSPATTQPATQPATQPPTRTGKDAQDIHTLAVRLTSLPEGVERRRALTAIRHVVSQPGFAMDALLGAGTQILDAVFAYVTHDRPEVVCDALWILSNIASSDHTAVVATRPGFVAYAVDVCLASPSIIIRDQAVWLLANVAGDREEFRVALAKLPALGLNLVAYARELVRRPTRPASEVDTLAWFCSNMVRDYSCTRHPDLFAWARAFVLPVLEEVMFGGAHPPGLGGAEESEEADGDVKVEGEPVHVALHHHTGHLHHDHHPHDHIVSTDTLCSVVHALYHLVYEDMPEDEDEEEGEDGAEGESKTDEAKDALSRVTLISNSPKWMPFLNTLLRDPDFTANPVLAEHVLQLAGSFCAGSSAQTGLMVRAGIVPLVVRQMLRSPSPRVRLEAAYILSNIATDAVEYRALISEGVLGPMVAVYARGAASLRLQLSYAFVCLVDNFVECPALMPLLRSLEWPRAVVGVLDAASARQPTVFMHALTLVRKAVAACEDVVEEFEEAGIADVLARESVRPHSAVAQSAMETLLRHYFGDERV